MLFALDGSNKNSLSKNTQTLQDLQSVNASPMNYECRKPACSTPLFLQLEWQILPNCLCMSCIWSCFEHRIHGNPSSSASHIFEDGSALLRTEK